jgi:hypothetical protein
MIYTIRSVILALCCLFLLSACGRSSGVESTPGKTVTIDNEGMVCFQAYCPNCGPIEGSFRPKGCFSSTVECTEVREQSIQVTVDREEKTIRISTHYIIVDYKLSQACNRDCSGVRPLRFDLAIPSGTYTVWLGDTEMGTINMPLGFEKDRSICFGDSY